MPRPLPRTLRALALPIALAGTLAACGRDDGDADATGATSTAARVTAAPTTAPAAFPVTIEHALGTTVVEAEPTRVVTVGVTEHDTVLALGVKPVGVTDWYGDQPYATWPWAQDELGDAKPEVLSTEDGFDPGVGADDEIRVQGLDALVLEDDFETEGGQAYIPLGRGRCPALGHGGTG